KLKMKQIVKALVRHLAISIPVPSPPKFYALLFGDLNCRSGNVGQRRPQYFFVPRIGIRLEIYSFRRQLVMLAVWKADFTKACLEQIILPRLISVSFRQGYVSHFL